MNYTPDDFTMQIAEVLERHEKTFYESFAAKCDNAVITAIVTSFAKVEEQHLLAFKRMREAQPPFNRCRQCTDEELYGAAHEVYNIIYPDVGKIPTAISSSNIHKAFDMAITMETQSATFYTLLAGITGPNIAILSRLAEGEKEHLRILTEQRKKI